MQGVSQKPWAEKKKRPSEIQAAFVVSDFTVVI